jgi:hypothetical protein
MRFVRLSHLGNVRMDNENHKIISIPLNVKLLVTTFLLEDHIKLLKGYRK